MGAPHRAVAPRLLGLVLALVLGLGNALPALAQQPTPEPTPQPIPLEEQEPRSLQQLRPPELAARAAVLLDAETGEVLYAKSPHDQLAIASLTKMVTALVAVERAPLSQPIRATKLSYSVPSVIGLDPGDTLTLEQILYGLILKSGNDAALAIAENLGGSSGQASIDHFVELMNQKVRQLGLHDTHFVNPNGLDADGHYSSAYDVAQVARAFMRVPILARIAGTRYYAIPAPPVEWIFQNINGLLYGFPGADGVKTGYEDRAGRCIAASATQGGHRLIAVVLNSDVYYVDAANLLHYGFTNYAWLLLNAKANPLLDQPQPAGEAARLAPATQPELLFAPSQLGSLQTLVQTERFEERVARTAQPASPTVVGEADKPSPLPSGGFD
ncbi:MAG: D-alanyl-D-alanine carboxypeptidase [Chloroflexi bacterium]|nr:D-alanyl-D-alanine carboxypeptidase [Chloroflexota bacterium]